MQKLLRVMLFLFGAGALGLSMYTLYTEGDIDSWQQTLAGIAALLGSFTSDGKKNDQSQGSSSDGSSRSTSPVLNRILLAWGKIFLLIGAITMIFETDYGFLLLILGGGSLMIEYIVRLIVSSTPDHIAITNPASGRTETVLTIVGLLLTCTGYGAIIGLPMIVYALWLFKQRSNAPKPGATSSYSGFYLEVVNPGKATRLAGQKIPLRDVMMIGREEASDIMIPDDYVSEPHAQLRRQGNEWFLVDVDSSNGTCINGISIQANTPIRIRNSDLIQLGGRVYVRLTR